MPRIKFDTTINAGHLLIVFGMMGSVLFAYTDLVRTIDNHELRIETMEHRADRDAVVQQQILQTLTTIREDIAGLKASPRQ